MSQEQPAFRSRRELRKAREAEQLSVATDQQDAAPQATAAVPPAPTQPASNPTSAGSPTPGQAKPAAPKPAAPKPAAPKPASPAAVPAAAKPVEPASIPADSGHAPARPVPRTPEAPEETFTQRSSQIRARDREALRTQKEQDAKDGQQADGGPVTRRQLRLQQLKEQALTAAHPVVPLPDAESAAPAIAKPAAPKPGPKPAVPGSAVQDSNPAVPGPAAPGPKPAVPGSAVQDPKPAVPGPAAPSPAVPDPAVPGPVPATPAPKPAKSPKGMTVEQALAARALIAEQARNQIAKMEHIAAADPEAVDPELLTQQIALAKRAAAVNQAPVAPAETPRPSKPSAKPGDTPAAKILAAKPPAAKPAQDAAAPSTANNLAMVTPLEFETVPGFDRPVMKRPATSHVPVVTRSGSAVTGASGLSIPGAPGMPGPGAPTKKAKPAGQRKKSAGRASQVIARAEAVARTTGEPAVGAVSAEPREGNSDDLFADLPRIPAVAAHGLEPLDAATAGLGRAKRSRLLQIGILAFGVVALISGIILIVSGLSS
ncbi:hypothetical protein PSET11_03089 [Arthrobacter ulcerisalmonis]|uniref:Uncharacterized protein n=1 Tax=Arthrobacter ulcerisalmonis TaxID=2483813 RepID=A0A3P5XW44_9MICC|nr:hypothetical protein [Arthrobacter ulcerisalmonis]VDC32358.1 hypothetical protein PSET11_03089 [Arthrobacter ulcerisalmonis]